MRLPILILLPHFLIYFIISFIFIYFFHNSQNTIFSHFSLPSLSLSFSLSPSVPAILPSFFFFRLPVFCSHLWCILPPPSFFLYPFSSVSRSVRTHYRRPASSENPHPSVQDTCEHRYFWLLEWLLELLVFLSL